MKTAKLSVLPIKDLNPAEYNPRKKLKPGDKEYEKIKHSIEEFGFADPVVVNSDMTIIGIFHQCTNKSFLRPDLNIILHADPEILQKRLQKRESLSAFEKRMTLK